MIEAKVAGLGGGRHHRLGGRWTAAALAAAENSNRLDPNEVPEERPFWIRTTINIQINISININKYINIKIYISININK